MHNSVHTKYVYIICKISAPNVILRKSSLADLIFSTRLPYISVSNNPLLFTLFSEQNTCLILIASSSKSHAVTLFLLKLQHFMPVFSAKYLLHMKRL